MRRHLLAGLLAVVLASCSSETAAKPAPAPAPVVQSVPGVASWYGPGFDGRLTASGVKFDQDAFTAAHKTLPFGTRVKVTNKANGQSVVVRITDRGPFTPGRTIDLSKAAAQKISMIGAGVAQVEIIVLD